MPDLPDIAKTEAAIVQLTNEFRRADKLVEVKRNSELDVTARLFAAYLAKTGRFAHEADGREPSDRAKAAGYKYCMIAENLALHQDSRGFRSEALAKLAVEGWKGSPPHRKNLELKGVTEIGVGVAKAPDAAPKYLSVQLFGRPESLKFQFKIENRASVPVSYTYSGKQTSIESKTIVTHTVCEPVALEFQKAGTWLKSADIASKFNARDGSLFLLKSASDGRVEITFEPFKR